MEPRLELYIGPMFAGKTSHLVSKLNLYSDMNMKVLRISHSLDVREKESHNDTLHVPGEKILTLRSSELRNLTEKIKSYQVIGIDECQFFPDLLEAVQEWLILKKVILCCGLSSDVFQKPFGKVSELISVCDDIVMLKAKCRECAKEGRFIDAPFTKRTVSVSEQTLIGGAEYYLPVCRFHYCSEKLLPLTEREDESPTELEFPICPS